ncbi:MAG: tetratricopeptide repeat protein [Woeseiaceae bacterium]
MIKKFMMVSVAIATAVFSTTAFAQDELRDDRVVLERETGNQQTMSENAYKRLGAIHELMGENQNAEAMEKSKALMANTRLNGYEKALIFQTIGFIHANQNELTKAIEYFEKSIAENALTPDSQQGMLYSLASLYMSQEQFRKAISTAREWFKYEAEPEGDAYMLIGSSFAQLEDYKSALPYVKKAISLSDKPQEPWYQLELAIYFELKQVAKAVPLLQKMIQYWPDKESYWDTLYGAHLQLEQDQPALSTLMVAYRKGLVEEEDKLLNLVRLNMFLEIPYTAGEILSAELAKGRIERTKKNLELLQSAWTAAQDYPRALNIMTELGKMTGDPTYAIDQAKIYNELTDWENVIKFANVALEQGYAKKGEAHLLIGTAYSELGQFRQSLRAFEAVEGVGNAEERANAKAWIGFVNDRLKMNAPVASNNS